MKLFASFIVAGTSVFCAALFAQESRPDTAPGPVSRIEVATVAWLAAVDVGGLPTQLASGCGLAANLCSPAPTGKRTANGPLTLDGTRSRLLKSTPFSRTLAGAPDGEYVLIQHETRFEFKPPALETLTTMKNRDASWKVAGYFIK